MEAVDCDRGRGGRVEDQTDTVEDEADVLFDDESVDDTDVVDDIDDPFAQLDEDAPDSRSAADASRAGANDPFDELGPATGETDAALDEAFERMDVGDLTEEDIWKSLDEDAEGGFGSVGEFGGAVSETNTTGSDPGGRVGAGERFADAGVERVISKRTYCQQCPHFSAPPAVACGHEGTTIVESVGFDEFRVRNCPMVDDDDPTFDATRGE